MPGGVLKSGWRKQVLKRFEMVRREGPGIGADIVWE